MVRLRKILPVLGWVSVALLPGCNLGGGAVDAEMEGTLVSAASGGVVLSDEGSLRLDIPAGALEEDTEIGISVVSFEEWPEGISLNGPVYRLEPAGLAFQQPITVRLEIDQERLQADALEEGIPLFWLAVQNNDGELEELENGLMEVSLDDGVVVVQAEINHFSLVYLVKVDTFLEVKLSIVIPRKQPLASEFFVDVGVWSQHKDSGISTLQFINLKGELFAYGPLSIRNVYINSPAVIRSDRVDMQLTSLLTGQRYTSNSANMWCERPGVGSYSLQVTATEHDTLNQVPDSPRNIILSATVECIAATVTPVGIAPEPLPPVSISTDTPLPDYFSGVELVISETDAEGTTFYDIRFTDTSIDRSSYTYIWNLQLPDGDDCKGNSGPLVESPTQPWLAHWDHPGCNHAAGETIEVTVSKGGQSVTLVGPALGPATVTP
jgi:hypothetical protein